MAHMSENVCVSCRRLKDSKECGICHEPVCKNCLQFLQEGTFAFYSEVPPELTHTNYCPACYDQHVASGLETYHELMERAKGFHFFFSTQKRPPPIIKVSKVVVHVVENTDRDEVILRLAFQAAQQNYNSIILAEVTSKKVRNKAYQKTIWSGFGTPATIDVSKLRED